MSCRLCRLEFAFCFALIVSVGSGVFGHSVAGQHSGLVVNVDTGLSYFSVQAAINAPETLAGHTIRVGVGVFREHVTVNKSVSLVSQDRSSTVIDGFGGTVVQFKSNARAIGGVQFHLNAILECLELPFLTLLGLLSLLLSRGCGKSQSETFV